MSDHDEDDPARDEQAAELQNEAIDAIQTLVNEHGWSREDVDGMLNGTVFG